MQGQQQPHGGNNLPHSLHVVGRSPARENGDICGEYVRVDLHQGSAVYQKPGATMAISYWRPMRRWVIDREGLRESEVCVAYADDATGCGHPGNAHLIWHVWDAAAQAHVPDTDIMAVDAPATVAFVGRDAGRENSGVNGEYELLDVRYSRPAYRHRCADTVIRYYAPEDRWLVSAAAETGNVCSAFAEAAGAPHPGLPELEWHFWEAQRGAFVPDLAARASAAPARVHVLGRCPQAENARICGTYHLAGVREGRPVYVQPGSHAVIRYSAKHDWWLIDCDGSAEPTLSSRLYQWVLNGDSTLASDRCSAYCEAQGTEHPGHSMLEWKVWDTQGGRHNFDPWVRVTTAPLALRVSGRGSARENGDIDGDYMLAGTHIGRAAYRKIGSGVAIRYWQPMRRWIVDREGLRNTDCCVAYADGAANAEHPASTGSVWHVFETSRGCHIADPRVTICVPDDAPLELPPALAPVAAAQHLGTKRRRVDAAESNFHVLAAAKDAQLQGGGMLANQGGPRWFGLFGA
mmetsp:Transcript_51685/g.160020  ORF Transcript_51685/g.160020 Transcript_51685/m.160020 type:complete len:519 (+) Transcript_51685:80-1636(+)